jgi:hypothetical protein
MAPPPPTTYTNWNNAPYSSRDWRGGPNYTGRGPLGYQRGDERIREDVCDRLTDDPRIDAGDVEVQVKNGEVTQRSTTDVAVMPDTAVQLLCTYAAGTSFSFAQAFEARISRTIKLFAW